MSNPAMVIVEDELMNSRSHPAEKTNAAEILGLDRSTLRFRMRKLDIRKP